MNASSWLLALALVVAVNPARLVGVLPRPGGVPRRGVAALGAAGTGAIFVSLALIADGLLDAIEVSGPTLQAGAGLVLILAAARDVLLGPPSAEPAMTGWGAALVPVAIPMVARPHAGVLALSAGATDGVWPVLAGALAIVLLAVGAAGVDAASVSGRVARWVAVLGSIGLVVIGVALTVDGVVSV